MKKARNEKMMSVGAVAKRAGLSVSAIHFYEREGLIRSQRDTANHRRFPRAVLRSLAIIKVGQSVGIPLAQIREALVDTLDGSPPTLAQWSAMSDGWHQDLSRRIDTLTRLRDHLTGCIGCGCLSLEHCALINPGDRAAAVGAGAIVLEAPPDSSHDG